MEDYQKVLYLLLGEKLKLMDGMELDVLYHKDISAIRLTLLKLFVFIIKYKIVEEFFIVTICMINLL